MIPKQSLSAFVLVILSICIGCGTGNSVTTTVSANSGNTSGRVSQNSFQSLQSAISAACNGTAPGDVVLTPGITTVSGTIQVPSNCTIEGGNTKSTVQFANGVNDGYVFETATGGAQNVVLKNFTIDGNNAGQTPTGNQRTGCIRFTAVNTFHIENVECANAYNHGIVILDRSTHGWIENNQVHDTTNGTGIIVGTTKLTSGISDIHITGNSIGPTGHANCIFVIGTVGNDYGVSNVTVNNNICRQPGDVGIEIGVGTSDATADGNQVFTSHAGSAGIMARGSRNVNITGNEITGSGSQTEDGVFVWGNTPTDATKAHNIRIDGNALRDQGRSAIDISSTNAGDVDGVCLGTNSITNAGVSPLTVSRNAWNVTPTGATCN